MARERAFERVAIRQRNLFPLPYLEAFSFSERRLSRRKRQSLSRQACVSNWANDAIETLNQMAGRGDSQGGDLSLPASSVSAVDEVEKNFRDLDPSADTHQSDRAALSELLSSASVYSDGRQDVAAYAKELVPWPLLGSAPIIACPRPQSQNIGQKHIFFKKKI